MNPMPPDDEPFGSEERKQAGLAMLSLMDVLEDEDIQRAILDLREAARRLQDLYVEHDVDPHQATLSIVSTALGTLLKPPEWET